MKHSQDWSVFTQLFRKDIRTTTEAWKGSVIFLAQSHCVHYNWQQQRLQRKNIHVKIMSYISTTFGISIFNYLFLHQWLLNKLLINVFTHLNISGGHIRRLLIRGTVPKQSINIKLKPGDEWNNKAGKNHFLHLISILEDTTTAEHSYLNMVSSERVSPVELSRGSATGRVLNLDSLAFSVGKCLLNCDR